MEILHLKLLVAVTFFVLVSVAHAQEKATVYVYEPPHKLMMTRVAPLIFCDDKELAEIPGGRFFIVRLAPGVHTFRSKAKKKGGAEIDLKSGVTYYLKVKLDADGFLLRYAGLELVAEENGRYDVKQLSPISPKDIKDRSLVVLKSEP